jgi:cell division protein FtsB
MIGIELPVARPPTQPRAPRRNGLRLPASRSGLTWLVALLIIGALLAIQVGRQVYANYSITQYAAGLHGQISDIEAQNERLRQQLQYLQSDAFISAEARRLANLGHPGDRVLIIPPGSEVTLPGGATPASTPDKPLIEQWLDLFFGS